MKPTLEYQLPREKPAYDAARTGLVWKDTLEEVILDLNRIWVRNDRPADQPAEVVLRELAVFLNRLQWRLDETRLKDQLS